MLGNAIQFQNPQQMLETMLMFAAAPSMMQMVTGQGETQVGMQEMTSVMMNTMQEKFKRTAQADEWKARQTELKNLKDYLKELGFTEDDLKHQSYDDLKALVTD